MREYSLEIKVFKIEEHFEHFIESVIGEGGGLMKRLVKGRTFRWSGNRLSM